MRYFILFLSTLFIISSCKKEPNSIYGTYIGESVQYSQDVFYEYDDYGNPTGNYEIRRDTTPPIIDTIVVTGQDNQFSLSRRDAVINPICSTMEGPNGCSSSDGSSGYSNYHEVQFVIADGRLKFSRGSSFWDGGPADEYNNSVFIGYK